MKDPRGSGLFTTPKRSRQMARVRKKDTPAELTVRRVLHAQGIRFRTHGQGLPGSPDIVNRLRRWAIFIHGCYWHAHQGCSRWRLPKRNRAFWAQKFATNRDRDRRNVQSLEKLGFNVLVIWECEVRDLAVLDDKLRVFLSDAPETGTRTQDDAGI